MVIMDALAVLLVLNASNAILLNPPNVFLLHAQADSISAQETAWLVHFIAQPVHQAPSAQV